MYGASGEPITSSQPLFSITMIATRPRRGTGRGRGVLVGGSPPHATAAEVAFEASAVASEEGS